MTPYFEPAESVSLKYGGSRKTKSPSPAAATVFSQDDARIRAYRSASEARCNAWVVGMTDSARVEPKGTLNRPLWLTRHSPFQQVEIRNKKVGVWDLGRPSLKLSRVCS